MENLSSDIFFRITHNFTSKRFLILYKTCKSINRLLTKRIILYKYLGKFYRNYLIHRIFIKYQNIFDFDKIPIIKWKDKYRHNTTQNYINNIPLKIFNENKIYFGIDNNNTIFVTFNISNYVYTLSNINIIPNFYNANNLYNTNNFYNISYTRTKKYINQNFIYSNSCLCCNNRNAYNYLINDNIILKTHSYNCACSNIFLCENSFNGISYHSEIKKVLANKIL